MSLPALGYNDLLATISANPRQHGTWTFAFLHRDGLSVNEAVVMYDKSPYGRFIWVPLWNQPGLMIPEPVWFHWLHAYYPDGSFPKFKLEKLPKPINFGWVALDRYLQPITNTTLAASEPRAPSVSAGDQNRHPGPAPSKVSATPSGTAPGAGAPEPAGMVVGTTSNHASRRFPAAAPARLPDTISPSALLAGSSPAVSQDAASPPVAGPSSATTTVTKTRMSMLAKRARDDESSSMLPSPKRARVEDAGASDLPTCIDPRLLL